MRLLSTLGRHGRKVCVCAQSRRSYGAAMAHDDVGCRDLGSEGGVSTADAKVWFFS